MDIELQKLGLRGISMICASGDTGAYGSEWLQLGRIERTRIDDSKRRRD